MTDACAPGVITITPASAGDDDARSLVADLDAELAPHYTAAQSHGLAFAALFQPHIRFFVVHCDGAPAGCGGIALADGFAELKRMYVRAGFRGCGVADALMMRLEAETVTAGATLLRLETGTAQHAALKFYERHGFQRCGIFPPYAGMSPEALATSIFMEKRLG